MAIRFNRNFNVGRVISRIVTGVLGLYVGGTILSTFGTTMTNTSSSLYSGLTLIGWTVGNMGNNGTGDCWYTCSGGGVQTVTNTNSLCNATASYSTDLNQPNCITATSGSGVLSVIGILVIAQVIMEFVNF